MAAAVPEAFITAHDALWRQAGLRPCERVLIHAVGSGVGLAAVQLARAMRALPFGTSRTPDKLERAKQFGLEAGFLVPHTPTIEEAKHWSASGNFAVVLDLVGGDYVNPSLHALAPGGRMMLIGTLAGGTAEIDLVAILSKRIMLEGTVLRARPLEEKIAVTRAFSSEVLPLFQNQVLRPVIDNTYDLKEIRAAHQRLESNESFGKIILRISE